MIEWFLTGLVSLLAWLWNSAMTLYYLGGFLVVVGGLIVFVASVLQLLWTRSKEHRTTPPAVPQQPVTIHIENMTIEVTEPQLRRLLSERDLNALPPADREAD